MTETLITNLMEMIPTGKEDAISRKDLGRQLGLSDRKTRDLVHEAREIYPILSNTHEGGYYLPGTKDEADAFINQQLSYITKINRTIAPVRRWIERKGQRRLNI